MNLINENSAGKKYEKRSSTMLSGQGPVPGLVIEDMEGETDRESS